MECVHHGHFLAYQHRHLKLHTSGPPTPATQLNESLSCCNNQLGCHVVAQAVETPTPKRCEIVLYSVLVPVSTVQLLLSLLLVLLHTLR